jgi:hypothetical protein
MKYEDSQHLWLPWIALADVFDDGRSSGANMDRPALRHLLAAIEVTDTQ